MEEKIKSLELWSNIQTLFLLIILLINIYAYIAVKEESKKALESSRGEKTIFKKLIVDEVETMKITVGMKGLTKKVEMSNVFGLLHIQSNGSSTPFIQMDLDKAQLKVSKGLMLENAFLEPGLIRAKGLGNQITLSAIDKISEVEILNLGDKNEDLFKDSVISLRTASGNAQINMGNPFFPVFQVNTQNEQKEIKECLVTVSDGKRNQIKIGNQETISKNGVEQKFPASTIGIYSGAGNLTWMAPK